jgi:NAD(P)H-dependent flavin oxidoreductase YrpB (nitropropane dioxygenase family)
MTERLGFPSRLPALLGIRLPIVQGGMSWASSSAALALAVSRAGALGTIAAGPMRPDALIAAIREVRAGTDQPFAVNVPLYNKRSAEFLDIAEAERVPILIASQAGRRRCHASAPSGRSGSMSSPPPPMLRRPRQRGWTRSSPSAARRAGIPRQTRFRQWCWCAPSRAR